MFTFMFWIIVILTFLIIYLLFRYTTLPYAVILQYWNTKYDTEGIVQPFTKTVIYESKYGQHIDTTMQVHERVHIEQIERLGSWNFVFQYIIELIKHGYTNNKFEVEARNRSNQELVNEMLNTVKDN